MAQKYTIYQKLGAILDQNRGVNLPPEPPKEILKADSKEELQIKALEKLQGDYLKGGFYKQTNDAHNKTLQVEPLRLMAYRDYENMEYYPIIAAALDLFMEEATTIGDNGKMLNIYSDSSRIKDILQDFFYGTLNINVNLPHWTRNLVKYGDNFVLMYPEKGKGIKEVRQLTNYETERIEKEENGKNIIRFKQKNSINNGDYNSFQVAHFRLLGDDKYIPYGSSILNKVRKTFHQLAMAEDSMLTYRLLRSTERRVFKIYVGNIDDKDIEPYIQRVAQRFKKTPQVNRNDGTSSYTYNAMPIDEDFFIPVRSENSGTQIDTLPGASNMAEIVDIEYLRDNLFTGLGVPKTFLSFDTAQGGGKNMSMEDIRFAKKINRIQQALIQELNKMAMIHLFLLGFEDDLANFTLSLTNPSINADILKTEALQKKMDVYERLVKYDEASGIAPMSMTRAKKTILGFSDNEIIEDLKEQRIERVVGEELKNTGSILTNSGIFKEVDAKFSKIIPLQPMGGGQSGGTETNQPTNTGDNANAPIGADEGNQEPFSLEDNTPIISSPTKGANESFFTKSKVLNEEALNMIKEIDNLLENKKSIRKKKSKKD